MTLRGRVVEAGARAIDDEIGEEIREHLAHILRKWPNTIETLADVALDAMLDCLTESADAVRAEVYELWAAAPTEPSDMLTDLIQVLREDR